ncbi:MAG TPA: helix-turn-helix domain-containing protein, partial [Gammaproteobacteria bacterium]|nr:helix-turn-helix domain-containing protein [Gammaproteobacteria bacterium]
SLDLRSVEETQRAAAWKHAAGTLFPGLSVRELYANPIAGSMQGFQLGQGQLWTILSPPLRVSYVPCASNDRRLRLLGETFSVMLQLQGTTVAWQNGRSCRLHPRDLCVVDGIMPFELEVTDDFSRLAFLQMPRYTVLSRHPYLERRTAEVFDPDEPGTSLLRDVLSSVLQSAPLLDSEQRAAALSAIAQLLGVPRAPHAAQLEDVSWRVRTALAFIDVQLADTTLTASRVADAQKISRRRLDEILLEAIGRPITAQIWLRRLAQAAGDLLEPEHASRTITEIAFAAGFDDAAHFSRAFKRRYHCTPREWRRRAKASVAAIPAAGKTGE